MHFIKISNFLEYGGWRRFDEFFEIKNVCKMVGSAAKAGTLQWDDSQRMRRGSNARRGSKDIPQLKTRPGSGDNVRPVFADNGKDITPKVSFYYMLAINSLKTKVI